MLKKKNKFNKGELELTFELWIFFTSQQGLAPSWQYVGCQFLCQALDRGSKEMLVFLEENWKHQLHILVLFANFRIRFKIAPSRSTNWKRLDIQIIQK